MKSSISYQNCLIRGESFQRETNGKWVSQYTLRRQHTKNKVNDFLSIKLNSIKLSRRKMPPTICSARSNEVD